MAARPNERRIQIPSPNGRRAGEEAVQYEVTELSLSKGRGN
jgi:hypothetical protein